MPLFGPVAVIFDPAAERLADGVVVSAHRLITGPLPHESLGNPDRLAANAGMSFIGLYILGIGFTMEPDERMSL